MLKCVMNQKILPPPPQQVKRITQYVLLTDYVCLCCLTSTGLIVQIQKHKIKNMHLYYPFFI